MHRLLLQWCAESLLCSSLRTICTIDEFVVWYVQKTYWGSTSRWIAIVGLTRETEKGYTQFALLEVHGLVRLLFFCLPVLWSGILATFRTDICCTVSCEILLDAWRFWMWMVSKSFFAQTNSNHRRFVLFVYVLDLLQWTFWCLPRLNWHWQRWRAPGVELSSC